MMEGLRLFRAFGIRVVIDYSWIVIFFLVIYLTAEGYAPQAASRLERWGMGVLIALLFFGSVLVHESAHVLVARKHGIRVSSIRIFVFGGIAQVSSEPRNGRHELLIAVVGPAASMMLGIFSSLCYLILIAAGIAGPASLIAGMLAFANMALAFFNMVPGLPMDGGRILRAVLWEKWNDLTRATKVASQLGNSFALTLIFMGVLQLFTNPNILMGLFFILIGLSVKHASLGGYQFTVLSESLSGLRVQEVMTSQVVSVDWLTSIDEFVRDYMHKHDHIFFPVQSGEELLGMVSPAQAETIPKDLWGFKQVRDIMTPIEQVPHLIPSDDAAAALKRMISANQGPMPVLEDGQVVGIVSSRDILNVYSIHSNLGEP
jgi:Zn-dependent protease/predicted transcriptional regulator